MTITPKHVSITVHVTDDQLGLIMDALYVRAGDKTAVADPLHESWAAWLVAFADELCDKFDAAVDT
jgi:hypothetical protein